MSPHVSVSLHPKTSELISIDSDGEILLDWLADWLTGTLLVK